MNMLLEKVPAILREAGEMIRSASAITTCITEKSGDANFVTAYDVEVQTFLERALSALYPNACFFAEEQENQPLTDAPTFFIDPIDGTTNFIRGLGQSCISVALLVEKKARYAWIYQPYAEELFFAHAGHGAFLTKNGTTTQLLRKDVPLAETLAAFGTDPYRKSETHTKTMQIADALLYRTLDIRRSGSAAIDLANIAAGRVDILYENLLSPWDFAAGKLLVEEAGGVVTQPNGDPLPLDVPSPVLAGAPTACREFITEIYPHA